MAPSLTSGIPSQLPLPFTLSKTLNPNPPSSSTKPKKKRSPVSSSSLPQKLLSLSLPPPPTHHLLKPRIPGNNLSDVTAFLVFVSAAAVGVLKLGRGRRPPPPLHRAIAPPRPSAARDECRVVRRIDSVALGFAGSDGGLAEPEAAIGRRWSSRIMHLARGSFWYQSEASARLVSRRNVARLARIQVSFVPIVNFQEMDLLMPITPPRPSTSQDECRVVHRIDNATLGFADSYSRLADAEAAIGRRWSSRVMSLARGSYQFQLQSEASDRLVSGRNIAHLARIQVPLVMPIAGFREIELLILGVLHLRYNAIKAEAHGDLVDISLEPTGKDVEQRDHDDCHSSNANDSRTIGSQLLFPEICTSTLDFPSSGRVEEENLQYQSELQRAIPVIAMVAGVLGAFTAGEGGCLEMVGFVALTSFLVYDILWASKRRMLWAELAEITDRVKFMSFLLSKRIIVQMK